MNAERKYKEKRLPADIAVGKRLKIVRKALNIEQLELAQVVGYSSAAGISHLETGLRGINMVLLKKLAEAFDMDPRVLGMLLLDDDDVNEEEVARIVRYSKLLKEKEVHRGFVGSGNGNQSFQLWSHIANMPPSRSQGMPDQDGLVTIDRHFPTNPR